jgi:hypothetical protein
VDYFYTATYRRLRGATWPSFAPALIRHLLLSDQLQHTVGEPIEIGTLSAYERPLPTMIEYDRLFSVQAVQA